MRSAAILTVLGATLALASPVHHQALHKRAYDYHVVTDIVIVTVTADAVAPILYPTQPPKQEPNPEPQPQPAKVTPIVYKQKPKKASSPVPTSSPAPPPPASYVAPKKTKAAAAPTTEAYKAAATPAADSYPTDYKSICLWHHNQHRNNHSASPLEWSDELASYAETTAKTCQFKHDMTQGGGGYGQNIAASGTEGELEDINVYLAIAITSQWYNGEIANMPYGQDSPPTQGVPEFLHLSQIVWKATTKVGCYTALCPAGTALDMKGYYTVCNYKSAGNVLGSFVANVPLPLNLPTINAK